MRLLAVADLHGKTARLAAVGSVVAEFARAVAEFGPGAVVVASSSLTGRNTGSRCCRPPVAWFSL